MDPKTTGGNDAPTFVLFYSNQCSHCAKVLTSLKEHQLTHMFELVDVVAKPPPSTITSVPTVYEKITYKIHVGEQVFELLDEMCKNLVTSYELKTNDTSGISFTDVDFQKSERCDNFSWF
jgi:hypothetical protein